VLFNKFAVRGALDNTLDKELRMVDKAEDKTPTDDVKDDKGTGDNHDLENFNEENIKDLDEDSQKKVKGFHADYTKKTQSLSEERKKFEEEKKALQDKLAVGEKWWEFEQNPENAKLVEEFNQWKAEKEKKLDDLEDDEDDLDDPTVKKLRKSVAQNQKELSDLQKATQVSNKMLVDLVSELQNKRYRDLSFEIDPKEVLTYARDNSLVNIKAAIEGRYSDEIKEDEFAKRLEEEKEKWQEQEKTKVVTPTMPLGRQVRKVIARKRGSTD
jgi:hypothetical protein